MTHHPPFARRRAAVPRWRTACAAAALVWAALAVAQPARPTAGAASRTGGDYIVAVVNTELVTAVEVAQRAERLQSDGGRAGTSRPGAELLRQQALDSMIDERVLVTFARESGVRIDEAELDRVVANIAAQNQLTVAQLRERMKSEGLDLHRLRSHLRDQLMVERVREREVASRIRISDADIERFLEEQRRKVAADTEYNLAQILVTVPEGAGDAVLAERRARIDAALARLRAGEDFAKVAQEVSEDSRREVGGEIGLKPSSRLPDLFVDAAKGLAVGQFSAQPLRSAAGFHVLKVIDRKEGNPFKVTQTHARHILLRVPERAQAEAVARRLAQFKRDIESAKRSFESVAREVSEDGSAEGGGELGWVSPGAFVPEFEEAMNALANGAISDPVASRFGIHLIQVLERRDVNPPEKDVREVARNQLREQRYEQAYLDWVKELRQRAYIEMREPPA